MAGKQDRDTQDSCGYSTGEVVVLQSENRYKGFLTTYFLNITERGRKAVRSECIARRGRLRVALVVRVLAKCGSRRGGERWREQPRLNVTHPGRMLRNAPECWPCWYLVYKHIHQRHGIHIDTEIQGRESSAEAVIFRAVISQPVN